MLGYREGTSDVFVVYVRQGVDPASLHLPELGRAIADPFCPHLLLPSSP